MGGYNLIRHMALCIAAVDIQGDFLLGWQPLPTSRSTELHVSLNMPSILGTSSSYRVE